MGGPGAEEDEETRLARAIAESKAQASKRTATIFAPSDLPDYQPRPEVNWGERWELEEALATVPASQGGAAAAAAMGMAHPEIDGSSLAGTGIARRAIPEALPAAELDPAERGFHADDDAAGSPADDGDDRPVWVKTYDPNEDDFYFYNPETRETTWEEPDASAAKIMLHHAIEGNARARRKLGLDPPGGPDDGGDVGDDGGAHLGAEGADGYGRVTMSEMLDDVKVYEYEDVRAVWNGMPTETEEERETREAAEAASRARKIRSAPGEAARRKGARGRRVKKRTRCRSGCGACRTSGSVGRTPPRASRAESSTREPPGCGRRRRRRPEPPRSPPRRTTTTTTTTAPGRRRRWARFRSGPSPRWRGSPRRRRAERPAPARRARLLLAQGVVLPRRRGVWQGPWSVDELRGWRSMLPMELAVRRAGADGSAPVDAGEDQNHNQNQNLASVLGDDELLARAAAMDVHLPPRATATQAEIAIETVIAMRAGNAGRGDDAAAAAAGTENRPAICRRRRRRRPRGCRHPRRPGQQPASPRPWSTRSSRVSTPSSTARWYPAGWTRRTWPGLSWRRLRGTESLRRRRRRRASATIGRAPGTRRRRGTTR